VHSCRIRVEAQGPSRTSNESSEESKKKKLLRCASHRGVPSETENAGFARTLFGLRKHIPTDPRARVLLHPRYPCTLISQEHAATDSAT